MKLWLVDELISKDVNSQSEALDLLPPEVVLSWRRKRIVHNQYYNTLIFTSKDKQTQYRVGLEVQRHISIENGTRRNFTITHFYVHKLKRWHITPNSNYIERHRHTFESSYGHIVNVRGSGMRRMLQIGYRFLLNARPIHIRPYR